MTSETKSPVGSDGAGTTHAGEAIDDGRGRIFPCEGCGADLTFHIGQQRLKCPYCGFEKEIELAPDARIEEQDFHAMLARVVELREAKRAQEQPAGDADDASQASEVRCESCGATVVFVGTLTSSECPYCASPLQRDNVHTAEDRVPVDGVLPFLIDHDRAARNLAAWIDSLWFAPNEFRRRGVKGRFNGVYLPFWTYDTLTANRYSGERGEHYWVTVGTGKNKSRQRRTRWYPASGHFQRFFDDVLVLGAQQMNRKLIDGLDPWPLARCAPFNQQMLAGYLARTYDVDLDAAFDLAKQRIDAAIAAEVRQRIGGDEQRVDGIDTRYGAITYKHLLLPVWLLAYRFHDKAYQVVVNAATGEVQGERPWSWVKILFAVLAALLLGGTIAFFARGG